MTVLAAQDVTRHYALSGGRMLRAVDGVSFALEAGSTLAVVGESGCGKSTLARVCALMEPPTAGTISITGKPAAADRALQLQNQMVFQNPYGSLNPRKTIGAALMEPLDINRRGDRRARTAEARAMLDRVGLRPEAFDRYPHMFSGGQRQRVAIARALMLQPRLVIADEPVSALDLSVQAQILNLLMDLQDEFKLAYLFISHDLTVVRHIAARVMVMYLGRVVEHGPAAGIFARPRHPYTRLLLAATPSVTSGGRTQQETVPGEPPSPLAPPAGCAFHTRCRHATRLCAKVRPALRPFDGGDVACHHAEEIAI